MLSLASQHRAEVLHGPGEGDMKLFPGFWAGDVPRVPGLDEHLIFVTIIFFLLFFKYFSTPCGCSNHLAEERSWKLPSCPEIAEGAT